MTPRLDQDMARYEGAKQAFAKRLVTALDNAGIPHRGRGAELQRRLQKHPQNRDEAPSLPAIRKWLEGDSLPEIKRIGLLADIAGVSVEWLLTGSESSQIPVPTEGVPVLTIAQAAAICSKGEKPTLDMSDDSIISPVKVGPRAFGVMMRGEAMVSQTGGRSYPEGTIVIIDPDMQPEPGQRVFARVNGQDYTIRELMDDAGLWLLRPFNPAYRMIELPERSDVLGVVRCAIHKE